MPPARSPSLPAPITPTPGPRRAKQPSCVDQPATDPSKATVYFYNLSDKPTVDLFVPSAKVKAIEGVAAGAGMSVPLKAPLTLDFEVQADGAPIATVAAVDLKRRGGVSIILSGSDGNYTASAVQNAFHRAN